MWGTKTLEERESKYNGHLKVVKSLGFGTYIQAQGLTQSGGIVESIWKKTLKKIVNHKLKIDSCLILGLGGGTLVKLINKYWPGAKITGVDIDPVMIELGEKYLGLDKSKVDIKITDAGKYISSISHQHSIFDLIIIDLYNGDQFPEKFRSPEFTKLVRRLLQKDGSAIFNRLYYGGKRPEAVKFGNMLQKEFGHVDFFYPEANLMLICELNSKSLI